MVSRVSRTPCLVKSVVIEGVDDLIEAKPADLARMRPFVAIEEQVSVSLGERANGEAVALREDPDLAIVPVAGSLGDTPILIVGTFHRHADDERVRPKLAQATEQQVEVGPIRILLHGTQE